MSIVIIRGHVWSSKWRQVYDTEYVVNEEGQIKNAITSLPLKPYDNGKGYFRVCIEGKHIYMQQIVGDHWKAEHKRMAIELHQTTELEWNHIDFDKANNAAYNLEYTTHLLNVHHNRNKMNYKAKKKNQNHTKDDTCPF